MVGSAGLPIRSTRLADVISDTFDSDDCRECFAEKILLMSEFQHPDPHLPALGIRQPWAELILRGIKTIEVRSQDTARRGPIYVYSSKKTDNRPAARLATEKFDLDLTALPTGVVVGVVTIADSRPTCADDEIASCVPADILEGCFGWHLRGPLRFAKPLDVTFLPYGVWFYPWRRKNAGRR